ncbi:MAG: SGNH/GDSL hydrolase family protein [Clostridia bacterium]
MKKKAICLLLCLILAVSSTLVFSGCSNSEKLQIVYLGDSIAEALLGPSPIVERDRYGYFAVLGKDNDYYFYNRSVSGHQTAQLLEVISRDDQGAQRTATLIKTADILHISIIGNDLLQRNVGEMVIDLMNEDTEYVDNILDTSYSNICKIIAKLKELNPTATIIMQTVYNPIYADSTLFNKSTREYLTQEGIGSDQYREIGKLLINRMNDVLKKYKENYPNDIDLIDINKAFDDISVADATRGENLIYSDWVHPSNEGHAVIADTTQTRLEELGLADHKKALKNYKTLRSEQLEDLFSDSVDIKAVKKQIKKADSCSEVTNIYFRAIDGKTPVYIEGENK